MAVATSILIFMMKMKTVFNWSTILRFNGLLTSATVLDTTKCVSDKHSNVSSVKITTFPINHLLSWKRRKNGKTTASKKYAEAVWPIKVSLAGKTDSKSTEAPRCFSCCTRVLGGS